MWSCSRSCSLPVSMLERLCLKISPTSTVPSCRVLSWMMTNHTPSPRIGAGGQRLRWWRAANTRGIKYWSSTSHYGITVLLSSYCDGQRLPEMLADLVAHRACVQMRIHTFFQPFGQWRFFSVNPFIRPPNYSDLSAVPVDSEKNGRRQ